MTIKNYFPTLLKKNSINDERIFPSLNMAKTGKNVLNDVHPSGVMSFFSKFVSSLPFFGRTQTMRISTEQECKGIFASLRSNDI